MKIWLTVDVHTVYRCIGISCFAASALEYVVSAAKVRPATVVQKGSE
jgi:hypothetical protein